LALTASRPLPLTYPKELKALGDYLKGKRPDLGLLQKGVAPGLGMDKDPAYYWETNRYAPSRRMIPETIQSLDYTPTIWQKWLLGKSLWRCPLSGDKPGGFYRFAMIGP
jgi:hypothetical protein